MSNQPPRLLSTRIDSIDGLIEAALGWNLDFRELDAGALDGHLSQFYDSDSLVTHIRLSKRIAQRAEAPPGMLNFGVLGHRVSTRWHGRDVDGESLLVFRELEAASQPGFEGHTLSFSERRLADVVRLTGVTEGQEFFEDTVRAVRAYPRALSMLRECLLLHFLQDEGDAGPSTARDAFRRYSLEFEIPAALLRVLASTRGEIRRPPSRVRDLARTRALAFIEGYPNDVVTVRDICRAVRVGERTLEYAFLEYFGVTPKAYLRALRLNAVRRALHQADPEVKVADLANQWGFWHMGQFAADYRKHFGELPSQTLSKGRVFVP